MLALGPVEEYGDSMGLCCTAFRARREYGANGGCVSTKRL